MTFVLFQMSCVIIKLEFLSQLNEEVNLSSHLNPLNLQSLEQSKNTPLFHSISP